MSMATAKIGFEKIIFMEQSKIENLGVNED